MWEMQCDVLVTSNVWGANNHFAYLWFVGLPCGAKSNDGVPLNEKKKKKWYDPGRKRHVPLGGPICAP